MQISARSAHLILAVALSLADQAQAGFKILCNTNVIERIDPIISPTNVSAHVHVVSGANTLNFTTASTSYNTLLNAPCTSCVVKEDRSLYWVPRLYYRAQDGTFTGVPIQGDYNGARGGITIYYQQRAPGQSSTVPAGITYKAFPPGFRMVAGDPFKRNFTNDFAGQAVTFRCLGYNNTNTEQEFPGLPPVPCKDGIRAQLNFPHCWDGNRTDSADHKSHVSYADPTQPNTGPNGGKCPPTHPVYLMQLFYEIVYYTGNFNTVFPWYGNTTPFVLANGDPTGYGYHGDFVNGWPVNLLENAANTCNNGDAGDAASCTNFTITTYNERLGCTVAPQVNEDVDGPMSLLPGCNAIQSGPASATVPATCTRAGAVAPAKTYYADQTQTFGYGYIGCGNDTGGYPTFSNPSYPSPMTVEKCVSACNQGNYKYAGIEYQGTCYCANSYNYPDRAPKPGILGNCDMKCPGNSSQYCGGANAISIYQKCAQGGAACKNTPSA